MPEVDEKTLTERAFERIDVRAELDLLENQLNELKVQYEQHFLGINSLAPDRLHADVKQLIRRIRKAPFKSSAMGYKLRALETRYRTFHTYWQRVLKEREDGTYTRDIFKAELRQKIAHDAAEATTARGEANRGMKELFETYRTALEKQSGRSVDINFSAFKESLVKRARDLKETHNVKKLTFSVTVKDGKVLVQAKALP